MARNKVFLYRVLVCVCVSCYYLIIYNLSIHLFIYLFIYFKKTVNKITYFNEFLSKVILFLHFNTFDMEITSKILLWSF